MGEIMTISPEQARQWPELKPLNQDYERLPYPVDALPELVRNAVNEVQEHVQAPIALIASSALSAISLSMQGHIDIARDNRLTGPTSLYLLSIGESGERKTTIDGCFTRAIVEYEAQAILDKAPALKQYSADFESYKAKCSGLLSQIKKLSSTGKSTEAQEKALQELVRAEPRRPKVPNLLMTDATPEALLYRLADEWPSAALISDEGGAVFGGHGMGKDSVMRYLSCLNSLWGGSTQRINRRTSQSFNVVNPRLTVHIQIQAPTLQEFLNRNGTLARGSGFLARFLIADPESTQGTRLYKAPSTTTPALDAYNSRITQILDTEVPMNGRVELEPALMQLSPDAKQAWVEFHNEVESNLSEGREFADIRDTASKAADNAARIAALFAYFESPTSSTTVTEQHMCSGVAVAGWHLFESQRFLSRVSISQDGQDVKILNDWLAFHCQKHDTDRLTKRLVQQLGPNPIRDIDRRDRALEKLVEAGRVVLEKAGKSDMVIVNPALTIGIPHEFA